MFFALARPLAPLVIFLGSVIALGAAELDPKVTARIAGGEAEFPVIIWLKDIPRHSLRGLSGPPRQNRPFALGRLHRNALESQGSVVTYLSRRFRGHVRSHPIGNSVSTRVNAEEALALAARSDVLGVYEDGKIALIRGAPQRLLAFGPSLMSAQFGPLATVTPGLSMIKADQIWATYGVQGDGAKVGNIDTGVDRNHPDLSGKIILFRDFVNGQSLSYDDEGHGTHTAGTHSGGQVSGTAIGVAPASTIIVAKGLASSGGGTSSGLLSCMNFMANPDGNPATDDAPDVVSNSWGADSASGFFRAAVQTWVALDIFPSFAIGNSGENGAGSAGEPGNYPESFGVGALTPGSTVASFSSLGPVTYDGVPHIKPDVAAMGVSVLSAQAGGGYVQLQGTSMACPHVSGLVALMRSFNPSLTVAQMRAAIESTAVDLAPAGNDNSSGFGRADGMAAFAALTPVLSIVSPVPGGALLPGVTQNVTWTLGSSLGVQDPLITNFDVFLSVDSGATFPTFLGNASPGNLRTLAINAPSTRTGTARLRVIGKQANGTARVTGTSTGDFAIDNPPVPPPLPDRFVLPGAAVTLDASATTDADPDPLGFTWSQVGGVPVALIDALTSVASFTAGARGDVHRFRLSVGDGLMTVTQNTTVSVNRVPLADAGVGQRVRPATTVTLDARGSTDPDGEALTYAWAQLTGTSVGPLGSVAQPTFTSPVTRGTTMTFQATASDSVESATDTVGVTVNRLPVAGTGGDQRVRPSTTVTLRGSTSSEPDLEPVTYLWTRVAGPAVAFNTLIPDPSFPAPGTRNVTQTFELRVHDGLEFATARASIHTNQLPVPRITAPSVVLPGATVTLDGASSSDPDGDAITTYTWTQGSGTLVAFDPTIPSPTFAAPATGGVTLSFNLVVSDGLETGALNNFQVRVNRPPVNAATAPLSVLPGGVVTMDSSASTDPDGDILSSTWVQTSGPSVTINAAATRPTFTAGTTRGTAYGFAVSVSDGVQSDSKNVTVTVNRLPSARVTAPALVVPDTSVTLDASGSTDPDGNALTYRWTLEEGALVELADTAPAPSFAAPLTRGAAFRFRLEVRDGLESVSLPVSLATNQLPAVKLAKELIAKPDERVTLDASETRDADGEVLTYRWTQTSGPAATFDPNAAQPVVDLTGLARGTELAFSLAVRDGAETAAASVVVRVNQAPDPGPAQSVTVVPGEVLTVRAAASDADGDALNYSWRQLSGPTVEMTRKSSDLTFTAPDVGKQTLSFALEVTDGTETASTPVTVTLADRTYEAAAAAGAGCEMRRGSRVGPLDGSLPVLWLWAAVVLVTRTVRRRS